MGYFNEILLKRSKHNTDIIPKRCGYTFRDPGQSYERDLRYGYYVIHCTVSGKGYFVHNGKTHTSCEGDIFVFPSFESVGYHSDPDEPWEYYWIAFVGRSAPRLDEIKDLVGKTQNVHLFKEIYEKACAGSLSADFVTSKIYELFDELFECTDFDINTYVERFMDYVSANITQKIQVEGIAAFMGITPDYLTRLVKKELDISPKTYITMQKLTLAESDLMLGKNVAEVAEKYAFCDQFQFSRIFKKYKGSSPTGYLRGSVSRE